MNSRTVLLLATGLVLIASCRSSRSNRNAPARNQPAAQAPAAPSAKSVLDHADSALQRVSQLEVEDQAPMAEQPGYAQNTAFMRRRLARTMGSGMMRRSHYFRRSFRPVGHRSLYPMRTIGWENPSTRWDNTRNPCLTLSM
jgi:hypothetical protein